MSETVAAYVAPSPPVRYEVTVTPTIMDGQEPKRYRCRHVDTAGHRCDAKLTRDEMPDHAEATARDGERHACCAICAFTIDRYTEQTCQRCVRTAQANITVIADVLDELEDVNLNAAYRGRLNWSVMALLGTGYVGRTPVQQWAYALGNRNVEGYNESENPRDITPIGMTLKTWEDDWRDRFGDARRDDPPLAAPTAAASLAYFHEKIPHAAQAHEAFDEFADWASELRGYVDRIKAVAGMSDWPLEANASCRKCNGGKLVRRYVHRDSNGITRYGLEDDWVCTYCGEITSQPEYFFGLKVSAAEAAGWVEIGVAADHVRRPQRMVRKWIDEGLVSAACSLESRRVVVDLDECREKVTPPAKHGAA